MTKNFLLYFLISFKKIDKTFFLEKVEQTILVSIQEPKEIEQLEFAIGTNKLLYQ